MKQIVQNMRTGEMALSEVPAPALRGPGALVRTRCSLISAGTEKGMMDLAKKSLLGKARQRPDLFKQFLNAVKRDGLRAALATAMARLDQPLLLGYSSSGEVLAVSHDLGDIAAGDRVACGGGGFASHAGVVYVPRNLLVKLPDAVSYEEACFACVAAVGMQALRVGRLELGERVVVIGLGLIGLLLVQIARANGCRVLGCDPDEGRLALAREFGLDAGCGPGELVKQCAVFTNGHGADAVIITAATQSNEPLDQAVEVSRFGGRIVGVGDFGMKITRKPFYEKELEFRMSMAYGPGRYDPQYEEKGIDYPRAYVPWTEQRNMASVVDLIEQGKVNVSKLITHRFDIDQAAEAYAALGAETPPAERGIGVILQYPEDEPVSNRIDLSAAPVAIRGKGDRVRIGLVGAGQYASGTLLPVLARMDDVELVGVATATGPSAEHSASKFGFRYCATDYRQVLDDESIDLVVVATRHDLHPVVTSAAMQAGKHVFVEKPLAVDEEQLAEVLAAQRESGCMVTVGFNRRFAPLTRQAMEQIGSNHGTLTITYRCNAGSMPRDHWGYDPEVGGGRIIGEACHFIDLVSFLDGSAPAFVYASCIAGKGAEVSEDSCFITVRLTSGSLGNVAYLAGGDKAFGKERVEVFGDGRVFVIEDFRRGVAVRGGSRKTHKMAQDKGQANQLRALIDAVKNGGENPVPLAESIASTLASIRAVDSLRSGMPVQVMAEAADE